MEDKIPQEQPNRLLQWLSQVADAIANERDVDKEKSNILHQANLEKDEGASRQLDSWFKVLQQYHLNPATKQEEYIEQLKELGIPQASAELAVARIRETPKKAELKHEERLTGIQFELARHNFVRAVMLAQQGHYKEEEIRHFQELALRQYASDYRNLPGFRVLVKEWEIPQHEVKRVLEQLLEEISTSVSNSDSLQYDGNTMQNLTLGQWIQHALESSSRW